MTFCPQCSAPRVECTVHGRFRPTHENCALSLDTGKLLPAPAIIQWDTLANPSSQEAVIAWARENQVDAIGFVAPNGSQCGLICPGLVVIRANNKDWDPNTADPQSLKEDFEKAKA